MRAPTERLRDILPAIAAIERYVPVDQADFEQNELIQAWCPRHLQIIGEAARAPPDAPRAGASAIPWPKIIGMRNVLVHGYFDIDTDIVWHAVSRDVSALKSAIEHLLASLERDQ